MVTVVAPDQVGISGITWTNKDAGIVPDTGGRTAYGTLVHKNTEPRVFVFPDVTGNVVLTTNANRLSNKTISNSTFDGISINSPVILNSRISGITPLEVVSGGFGKTVFSGFFDFSNVDFSSGLELSKFQNNGIENADLGGEFNWRKFAPNSVTTVKITDNTVESADLFSRDLLGAVTTDKIGSGAVDTRHMIDSTIGLRPDILLNPFRIVPGAEMADNSVRTRHIQADAVNSSKISNGTITLADINSNVVLPPPSTGGNSYHFILENQSYSNYRTKHTIVQHNYSGALRVYICNTESQIRLQLWRNNTRIFNTQPSIPNLRNKCRDFSLSIQSNSLQVGDILYVFKSTADRILSFYTIYEAE